MAVTVVDKDNFMDQAQGKELQSERVDEKELHQPVGRRGQRVDETADKTAKVADPEPKAATKVENETDLADDEYAQLTEKQQRAVNKKHRAMKEADEFAEEQYARAKAAERRADEAEARAKALEEKGKPTPVEAKEPDPKDFTNDKGEFDAFGYAKALAKHAAEEAVKADRKEQDRLNREAAQARADQEYLGRLKASVKDIPDWQDVAEAAADMNVSGPLTGYLRDNTDAPGPLLYHLAQHPDVLERLNALPAIKAISEITKLELSLTKEPAKTDPEVKTKPRAPEPIAPLSNGGAVMHKDPRDMTVQDHIEDEYRLAREASRARKRH